MTPSDTDVTPSPGFLLYQTEDGQTRVECRLEDETLWLTQAQMAELFQTSVPNINNHLKTLFEEAELREEATIQEYLIVRSEGNRSVSREMAVQLFALSPCKLLPSRSHGDAG